MDEPSVYRSCTLEKVSHDKLIKQDHKTIMTVFSPTRNCGASIIPKFRLMKLISLIKSNSEIMHKSL